MRGSFFEFEYVDEEELFFADHLIYFVGDDRTIRSIGGRRPNGSARGGRRLTEGEAAAVCSSPTRGEEDCLPIGAMSADNLSKAIKGIISSIYIWLFIV